MLTPPARQQRVAEQRKDMKRTLPSPHMSPLNTSSMARTALLSVVAFVPVLAFASGGGHHEPSLGDLKHPWINFLTYIVLLYVVAAKPIKNAWRGRAETIRADVESAQTELSNAEQALKAVEEATRATKDRQAAVYQELVTQGEAEAAAVIADARARAERIAHQANELIAGESRAAQVAMRRQLIARAEAIARSRFESGAMSHRDSAYVDAALNTAHRLVH